MLWLHRWWCHFFCRCQVCVPMELFVLPSISLLCFVRSPVSLPHYAGWSLYALDNIWSFHRSPLLLPLLIPPVYKFFLLWYRIFIICGSLFYYHFSLSWLSFILADIIILYYFKIVYVHFVLEQLPDWLCCTWLNIISLFYYSILAYKSQIILLSILVTIQFPVKA